jgi:hypothetical protein
MKKMAGPLSHEKDRYRLFPLEETKLRKPNGFSSLGKVSRKGVVVLPILLLIPTLCLLFAWQVRAEDGKANRQKQTRADYARLART